MTAATIPDQGGRTKQDPHKLGHDAGRGEASDYRYEGPAPKRIVVGYGFWIFLISDIILFSAIFATYAVLVDATDGGPSGRDLFRLEMVAVQTGLLLVSSFTCGLAMVASSVKHLLWTQLALLVTGLLGFGFLALEFTEFATMIAEGAGPRRSAFLSAFFTLVGCHGLHVGVGLLWLGTMMAQISAKGFRDDIMRRLLCFSLFWHALDIVWVGVFTIVYLLGTA